MRRGSTGHCRIANRGRESLINNVGAHSLEMSNSSWCSRRVDSNFERMRSRTHPALEADTGTCTTCSRAGVLSTTHRSAHTLPSKIVAPGPSMSLWSSFFRPASRAGRRTAKAGPRSYDSLEVHIAQALKSATFSCPLSQHSPQRCFVCSQRRSASALIPCVRSFTGVSASRG